MTDNLPSRRDSQQSAKSSATSIEEFTRPWARLCSAYPHCDQSTATLVTYHEHLSRFDVPRIMAAVDSAIQTCKFFPSVAELIERIPKHLQAYLPPPRPSKEEAQAVLSQLSDLRAALEKKGEETKQRRIAERKLVLQDQARFLQGERSEDC